jgi:hypothetical protein
VAAAVKRPIIGPNTTRASVMPRSRATIVPAVMPPPKIMTLAAASHLKRFGIENPSSTRTGRSTGLSKAIGDPPPTLNTHANVR